MITAKPPYRALRRQLILRDSLVFLILTLIVAVLFAVTLFLFKSFSTHRQDLAERWYTRGRKDLDKNQPEPAINDLRNALGYDPDNREYAFALAQALEQAGQIDQSFTYFSNLLDTQPGSGLLNLQLARLSLRKGAIQNALHYYRASIYGNWEDDALKNRRAVRLELIQSMLDYGQHEAARTELLIASEDTADDPAALPRLAFLMSEAREYTLAVPLYQQALAAKPDDITLLEAAGHAAFSLGRYTSAQKYLQQAADQRVKQNQGEPASGPRSELDFASRITALFPSPHLPPTVRLARIQHLAGLVPPLISSCREQLESRGADSASINELDQTWTTESKKWTTARLPKDSDARSDELQLIYKIANQTAQSCPASSGDDMLLEMIAKSPESVLE